jgi:hypothetical protein
MAAASCVQVGSLGFKNTPLRRAPCPTVPMCKVSIVIVLNSMSIVTVQQGRIPTEEATRVHFLDGVMEDSWGKASRKVKWDRHVPAGSFLKIRIDTNTNVFQTGGSAIPNKVEHFQINSMDVMPQLETALRGEATAHITVSFASPGEIGSLLNLPCGFTMTIGPIDNKTFSQ